MKGLILSGGKGSRLYPLTYTSAKQLVPVANKPVLFRVIEAIRDAGITDIGIVVGVDDNARQVREAVGRGGRWGVNVTFIPQDAPLGLAHAVKISQDFLGDDRFVMFLGDNVIQGGISPLIRQFEHSIWNSQIVLTRVERPEQYGVAEVAEDGSIVRLVEKPKEPPSDLALVGIYMFDHHIFDAVHAIKPSARGELEITDAIQWLVDNGYAVHPYVHRGWWIDTGAPIDMLAANDKVLEELSHVVKGFVDKDSRVSDNVTVEAGAEIINSVVRGPAIIGEGTRIVNSYVGPFTSIHHHCLVEDSEIEHCIVLEHSQIVDIPVRVADSLIGRHVELTRSPYKPKAYKLTLGDHSKVGILQLPKSLPALAAGILQSHQAWRVRSEAARFELDYPSPAYHVDEGLEGAAQSERLAQTVAELAQKLARLKYAYGAWPLFDPGAYFDLYPCHLASLSRVEETQQIVRVRLYADLLAPAFRIAERYWVESFLPAYHAGFSGDAIDAFRAHLHGEAVPTLARLLEEAVGVTQGALDLLAGNLEVVGVLGGLEERIQHRPRPGATLAPELPAGLQHLPRTMPTLTLDVIFPAPEARPVGGEVWMDFEAQQAFRSQ